MPATEFSIDGCEEAIIWTTATKQEVPKAIRSDETLTIYMNNDEGPKWLRGPIDGPDDAWANAVVTLGERAVRFTHDLAYYAEPKWSGQTVQTSVA